MCVAGDAAMLGGRELLLGGNVKVWCYSNWGLREVALQPHGSIAAGREDVACLGQEVSMAHPPVFNAFFCWCRALR